MSSSKIPASASLVGTVAMNNLTPRTVLQTLFRFRFRKAHMQIYHHEARVRGAVLVAPYSTRPPRIVRHLRKSCRTRPAYRSSAKVYSNLYGCNGNLFTTNIRPRHDARRADGSMRAMFPMIKKPTLMRNFGSALLKMGTRNAPLARTRVIARNVAWR